MQNQKNILLVANWESGVGYAWWLMENFWVCINQHFNRKNQHCILVYPEITGLPAAISESSISVKQLNVKHRSIRNLLSLRKLIKQNNINYIYFSDYPSYSFFYILLKLWGIRKIVVHDHTPGERTQPAGLTRVIKTLIQKTPWFTADHFVAVTSYIYQRHIKVNCIPAHKCSVASNGIQPIDLTTCDRHYAQSIFNIPDDYHIVVSTGRASYYKGIDFLIQCAAELIQQQKTQNLHFLFCGDGPNLNDFRTLAKQLNVEQHFTFAGKRQDIKQILPCCHTGFHAATGEVGYSLSILEYMSSGLVTLVPDNPSTSLSINHMENGIIYKHKDIQSACDAIKYSMQDSTKVKKISDNAILAVQENYNIQSTNQRLIKILDPVFSGS